MKKLMRFLLQNNQPNGHQEVIYQCVNGCTFSKDMRIVINLHKHKVVRCPYCNSNKLSIVE